MERFEKGAHKLLCLRHASSPPFSSFLPLSVSSLPSGCVKRCGAAWVSAQTLEPSPKSDTHTHTQTYVHPCTATALEEAHLHGRRKMGGARAEKKKAFEKLMSPDGSQRVAKDWDISHLAELVCVCVCGYSFIRRLHSVLHNKLIMFLFTADRAGRGR